MVAVCVASCGRGVQTGDDLAKAVQAAIEEKDFNAFMALADLEGAALNESLLFRTLGTQVTSTLPVARVTYEPLTGSDDGDIWVVFEGNQSVSMPGNATITPVSRVNFPAKKIGSVFRLHAGHEFGPDFAF